MKSFHHVIVILVYTLITSSFSISVARQSPSQELYHRLGDAVRRETTFFKEVQVHQYNDYGSLEIFQFTVPAGSLTLKWTVRGAETNKKCTTRKIISHLQFGVYPLFTPEGQNPNKSFPENFYSHQEYQYSMSVKSNETTSMELLVKYPLPGDWFLASYVSENVDQVIKKITSSKCRYGLGVGVSATVPLNQMAKVLSTGKEFTLPFKADESSILFKFFINDNMWRYRVVLSNCSAAGTAIKCPFHILSRGGSYPSPGGPGTHSVHCNQSSAHTPCSLSVQGPLLDQWHYIAIFKLINKTITFTLQVQPFECLPVVYHQQGPNKANQTSKKNLTGTALKFHPVHPSQHPTESEADDSEVTEDRYNHTNYTNASRNSNMAQSGVHLRNTSGDGNISYTRLLTNLCEDPLAGNPLAGQYCPDIYRLDRLESATSPDFTMYTYNGKSDVETLSLCDHHVGVVRFDVLPLKDIGGTLVFSAGMKQENSSRQHTTIEACIQQGSLPLNGSHLLCSDTAVKFNLSTFMQDGNASTDLFFPYPQPGMWFVAMRPKCFTNDSSVTQSCDDPERNVVMKIVVAPCVAGDCGRYGNCYSYKKGAYSLTSCSCVAGYKGYMCTDGTNATSDRTQLTFTLLLTLSNMFFWPAIILATYRRYYVEAVVYLANMFFSTIYHACDVAGMSIFRKCIMPYGVLQYCDFFCSIMSFWVTLLAVAKIPAPFRSVAHMVGVIGLAMGVQWQEHGLWTNVVPISAGAVIVITSWVVRCCREKRCYPRKWHVLLRLIIGFMIAAVGLCIFVFIETDKNYAYTHSGWHFCMSVCIIFLLPNRKLIILDKTPSESSVYELGGSETVNLVPADSLAIHAGDGDDIHL